MKNWKKALSLACSAALAFSLGVPAFASTSKEITDLSTIVDSGQEFNFKGSVNTGTIKITMDTAGTVAINPYKLAVTVEGDDSTGTKSTKSVISNNSYIKNESNVAIGIAVSPAATSNGEATVTGKTALDGSETGKAVAIAFEAANADTGADGLDDDGWAAKKAEKIAVTDSAPETPADTKVTMEVGNTTAQYAVFHLTGEAVEEPSDGTSWASTDTVDVAVAFFFTPKSSDANTPAGNPSAGTISDGNSGSWDTTSNSSGTLTLSAESAITNAEGDASNYSVEYTWTCDNDDVTVTKDTTDGKKCSVDVSGATAGDPCNITVTVVVTATGTDTAGYAGTYSTTQALTIA